MTQRFTIIIEKGQDGWWVASIPEVPGAFSQGRTKKQAREMVLDAMSELMIARRELALSKRKSHSYVESQEFRFAP
ncbi:MAG: type II toxin-antitoxin system HicB family antitoxin [Armatimonadetes bacterium]|nr:type II toxin-antitoxin system HicB family antitoxin [Armatimonadota bacterium]